VAQLVEHHLAKVRVAGSNPVVRSIRVLSRVALRLVALFCGVVLAGCTQTERYDAMVAAASDTRDAFAEIAELVQSDAGYEVGFVFGSSGLLREQVLADAPFDVYVSANTAYVDELISAGAAVEESRLAFAEGRLALISASETTLPRSIADLDESLRIVIANPSHAPYGVAAREAMIESGVYEALRGRLVYADNVADAVRIVDSGEADVGVVALALVVQRDHTLVDQGLHAPIRQAAVLTKRGSSNSAAEAFLVALSSPRGQAILQRYGFTVES
jgi:molybdate transport system substrate-binding protein